MGRTRAVLAASVAALLLAAPAPAAGADPVPAQPVRYQPPVTGPVIDPFRPPATPYGPGNRGIDYATTPGEPVAAPADGEVTFAGAVGGQLHVVILHGDGIRTSLSFLAAVLVARGQRVVAGQPVGRARGSLHLGARRGEIYLDPATLFSDGAGGRSALVPDGPERPLGADQEAAGLARLMAGIVPRAVLPGLASLPGPAIGAAARSAGEVETLTRAAAAAGVPTGLAVLAVAAAATAEQGPCTPAGTPPPTPPAGRRLLVLVGGLGSSSTSASVFGLDAAALGYGPADVVRFSYRGGTTAQQTYAPADTLDGIDGPARRLAALLAELAATHPGQPIDVVAHSMGGLVARAALAPGSGAPPPATLVTLATPHGGADLAMVGRASTGSMGGRLAAPVIARAPGVGLDPASRSVADLAPGSPFLRRLAAAGPPPPPTRVASIGSRSDLVVPPTRARWPGVPSTVVDLPLGAMAHDALPRSAAATREVALAVAGAPPTCRSRRDAVLDAAASLAVQAGTYGLGIPAGAGLAAPLPVSPVLLPLAGP
ncbi:MAG: peptidoglycan DD-metalloendopeptidase family protein [Acidimicrobiales bacterium]